MKDLFTTLFAATVISVILDDGVVVADDGDVEEVKICWPPEVAHGNVDHESFNKRMLVARVSCEHGFTLVGNNLIKCMDGIWSADMPVCAKIGGCDPRVLPEIPHGRRQSIRRFRGAVYRHKCDRGFQMYGQANVYCIGDTWQPSRMPICAKPGCDPSEVETIVQGESKRLLNGSIFKFRCDPGTTMHGPETIFCDGHKWNDTAPRCLSPTEPPTLSALVNGELVTETPVQVRRGQMVGLMCEGQGGNPVPSLAFTRNNVTIGEENSARNAIKFEARQMDNGATFKCVAKNEVVQVDSKPLVFVVSFPPERVEVRGPDQLLPGAGELSVTCQSALSEPATSLSWRTSILDENDKVIVEDTLNTENRISDDLETQGRVTMVTLSLNMAQMKAKAARRGQKILKLIVKCVGDHPNLDSEIVSEVKEIDILESPGFPQLFTDSHRRPDDQGHFQFDDSDQEHGVICKSEPRGHPPAQIVWTVDNQSFKGAEWNEHDVTFSEIRASPFTYKNGSEVTCTVIHKTLPRPLVRATRIFWSTPAVKPSSVHEQILNILESIEVHTESSKLPREMTTEFDIQETIATEIPEETSTEHEDDHDNTLDDNSLEDSYQYDSYFDAYDDEYVYEYPEFKVKNEKMLIQPELMNEKVFRMEALPENDVIKSRDEAVDKNNEISPKESPFTQAGSHKEISTLLMIFTIGSSILVKFTLI